MSLIKAIWNSTMSSSLFLYLLVLQLSTTVKVNITTTSVNMFSIGVCKLLTLQAPLETWNSPPPDDPTTFSPLMLSLFPKYCIPPLLFKESNMQNHDNPSSIPWMHPLSPRGTNMSWGRIFLLPFLRPPVPLYLAI